MYNGDRCTAIFGHGQNIYVRIRYNKLHARTFENENRRTQINSIFVHFGEISLAVFRRENA